MLVTGASGLIGKLAVKALSDRHRTRSLSRRPAPGHEYVPADITNMESIRPAFEGVNVVVHLAALLPRASDHDLLRVNVQGAYNVFEAARAAGAKRVVFASSGAVMGAYHAEEPFRTLLAWTHESIPGVAQRLRSAKGSPAIDTSRPWRVISDADLPRPNSFYGFTKVAGEALGRYFHDAFGLSVLCIRFGAVAAEDRPGSPTAAAVYMSQRDAAQVIVRAVEAEANVGFAAFYALSDNAARFRDLDHARRLLGFVPEDGILEWPPSGT